MEGWGACWAPNFRAVIWLELLLKYKDSTEEDWKCVIWSDEYNVERGSDPQEYGFFIYTPKEERTKGRISKFKG